MQRIYLVARERIISHRNEIHSDDLSLGALNGIKYGPVRIVPDSVDPLDLFDELEQEFTALNPTFHARAFSICLENGREISCLSY